MPLHNTWEHLQEGCRLNSTLRLTFIHGPSSLLAGIDALISFDDYLSCHLVFLLQQLESNRED